MILTTSALTPVVGSANALDPADVNAQELTVGQENIVLRARQIYEIEWTPLRDVIKWSRRGVFKAGETVKGLPYGMPLENNYVPLTTSFSEFLEEVDDRNSRFYRSIATRHRDAPYYSLDCSAFITWAWGLEERYMTGSLPLVATDMGRDIRNIQVGDALNMSENHVVLITEVNYDKDGEISAIGIMELDPPKAKFTLYGEDGDLPLNDVRRKYLNNGFTILRYNERESVVYLHDCVVPIDKDYCNECNDADFITCLQFFDRKQGVRYLDAIGFIENNGVLNGQSRSTVTYDFEIARGMFFFLLSKHANANLSGYDESAFEDVPLEEWYGRSIAWAVEIGLADGDMDRFEPRQYISNEEIAHIMFDYLRMRNNQSSNTNPSLLLGKTAIHK